MKQKNPPIGVAAGRFLLAQTVSLLGSSLVQYAIIWHITLSTSSGIMLTIATVCGFVPQLLISLFAGVLLDRIDRKRVIMVADGMIALATLVLAILFFSGYGQTWLLFVVLAIRSAGTGVQTPAVQAVLPQITPKEQLMRVNGLHSTLNSVSVFLSPALSGALLSFTSLELVLLVDVATAVLAIFITAFLRIPKTVPTGAGSAFGDFKEGFAYLKSNAFVRRLLCFQFVVLFLISPAAFLTPLMISRSFGPEVWRLTLSEMVYSLGSILGGVLITTWGGFQNRMKTVLIAAVVYSICMLGLGAFPWFLLYLVLNMCIGVASPCYSAPLTVTVQERVEPRLHGRVFSFMQIAGSCALPLGMVLFGPLADFVPIQVLLVSCGAVVLLCVLWGFRRMLRA